ncbi:MAG: hypothetical protein ACO25L_03600 [Candidatus Nanopelagicales bacterium]
MALWGKKDSFSSGLTGTITINLGTKIVTGTGTTFASAGISTGDVLVVGAGGTYGQAIISGVTSATQLSIGSTQFLIPSGSGTIVGAAYTVTQKPKSTLHGQQYQTPDVKSNKFSAVFGVDTTETSVAAGRTVGGKKSAYAVAHAGWVGVTTYSDCHGKLRVKSETLVAFSGITTGTGDAADDARFPDS